MADDLAVTPGSGATVAAYDIQSKLHQVVIWPGEYETVAAAQATSALGATGAVGDYLTGLLLVPASVSPGAVTITDGTGTAITVFAGGTTSCSNLVPFYVPVGARSGNGAWKVTTGSSISVIGFGQFT